MKQVIGALLLGVGILIAGASGLCSVVLVGSMMTEGGAFGGVQGFVGMLPGVAVFGGIPFAIGLGLFFVGRSLLREDRGPP